MITLQKLGKYFVVLVLATGLFACNDDDNTTTFTVIGDVYVTKRLIDEQEMFAKSYFVYGNQAMEVAKVTTPDAEVIDLEATNSYEDVFAKVPTSSDYTTETPEEANYQFNVVNEGIPHQSIDKLVFDDLQLPVMTKDTMENHTLIVEWDTDDDVDAYMVQLINESGITIFSSQFLSNQVTHFEIESITNEYGTWATGYPVEDDIYNLELLAITFDPEAGNADFRYHLQEIAIREKEITWK